MSTNEVHNQNEKENEAIQGKEGCNGKLMKLIIEYNCGKLMKIVTKFTYRKLSKIVRSLRPESSENIPILFQGADLYFSNQNYLRNPKMGSKQSVVVPPTTDFFKKLFFDKKNVEKIGHFVDF